MAFIKELYTVHFHWYKPDCSHIFVTFSSFTPDSVSWLSKRQNNRSSWHKDLALEIWGQKADMQETSRVNDKPVNELLQNSRWSTLSH